MSKSKKSGVSKKAKEAKDLIATWLPTNKAKKLAMWGVIATLMVITFIHGLPFLYLGAAAIGVAAYALYPKKMENWFDSHQPLFLGASIGFLLGGGGFVSLLGLPLGAWAGQYLGDKANQAYDTANYVADTVKPVKNLYTYPKRAATTLWNSASNVMNSIKNEVNVLLNDVDESEGSDNEAELGSAQSPIRVKAELPRRTTAVPNKNFPKPIPLAKTTLKTNLTTKTRIPEKAAVPAKINLETTTRIPASAAVPAKINLATTTRIPAKAPKPAKVNFAAPKDFVSVPVRTTPKSFSAPQEIPVSNPLPNMATSSNIPTVKPHEIPVMVNTPSPTSAFNTVPKPTLPVKETARKVTIPKTVTPISSVPSTEKVILTSKSYIVRKVPQQPALTMQPNSSSSLKKKVPPPQLLANIDEPKKASSGGYFSSLMNGWNLFSQALSRYPKVIEKDEDSGESQALHFSHRL